MAHQFTASAVEGGLLRKEMAGLDAAGAPRLLRTLPDQIMGLDATDFIIILCSIIVLVLILILVAVCFYRSRREHEVSGSKTWSLWKVTSSQGIGIRRAPDIKGKKSGCVLSPGDIFRVVREVEQDGVMYLKLQGVRQNWVFDKSEEHGTLCERYEGAEPQKLARGRKPQRKKQGEQSEGTAV